MNAPLQRVLPQQLFCGLYYGTNHIRTDVNPADNPTRYNWTRGREGGPCPAWVEPLLRGDPAAFDCEHASRGSCAPKRGLLPVAELSP